MEAHPPCLLPKGLHPSGRPLGGAHHPPSPLPRRKGELVRRDSEGHPQTPARRAVPLWTPPERKEDGVARRGSGCPEGCKPFGRRYGGCASITYFISFCSPFLVGRGLGGWCARTAGGYSRGTPTVEDVPHAHGPKGESEGHRPIGRRSGVCRARRKGGVQRGAAPLAGV